MTEGLSFPTSMDFIDSNNILVLQKDTGTDILVSNGILQKKPVLKDKLTQRESVDYLESHIVEKILCFFILLNQTMVISH